MMLVVGLLIALIILMLAVRSVAGWILPEATAAWLGDGISAVISYGWKISVLGLAGSLVYLAVQASLAP